MRWAIATTAGMLLSSVSGAQSSQLRAKLECPQRDDTGRVVCQLVLGATADHIVWADALVVETPSFVKPLRARVVGDVPARGATAVTLKLAFVASDRGTARVSVRGRAVLCEQREGSAPAEPRRRCRSASKQVTADVVVAPRGPTPDD